jgi:hypothetical protein
MKINRSKMNALAVVVIATVAMSLFSFKPTPGGDYFEIKAGGKTVIEQYVHADKEIKVLDLTGYKNESLTVFYSECGQIGKSRALSVRNGDKVLKTWNFENAAADEKRAAMVCQVKDILESTKNVPGALTLVYTSRDHKEQVLARLSGNDVKASLKQPGK